MSSKSIVHNHKFRAETITASTTAIDALLFVSAIPVLIYQLSWQRALSALLGSELVAVALLLASLMLGLALGSLAGGALARRGIALLPLLAAGAMASGAVSLAALPIFAVLGILAGGSGLTVVTLAVAAGLVLVSALPIGASLPLCIEIPRRPRRIGAAVGRRVSIAASGAGAACLAGLLLSSGTGALDLPDAICFSAIVNAAIACAALLLHWRAGPDDERRGSAVSGMATLSAPVASRARKPMLSFAASLAIAAAVGCVAWSYEVLFLRTLLYAAGSSATALVATLGAFLIGLASGADQAGRNCAVLTRDGTTRRAVGALMKANFAGILFLPLIAHAAWLDRGVIGVAVMLTFLAGRYWGALLPYLAELGIAIDGAFGPRVACLAGAHHVGAAVGAGLTGLALYAGLGLPATAAILAVAGLLSTALAVSSLAAPRWEKMLRASFAGGLGLFATAALPLGSTGALERLHEIGALNTAALVPDAESP